jgi:hypothetical protein
MRVYALSGFHVPFVGFWLIGTILALAWNVPVARHLVALAGLVWAGLSAIGADLSRAAYPPFFFITAVSFMTGAGLLLAARANESVRDFGLTLSTYGCFGLAIGVAGIMVGNVPSGTFAMPLWLLAVAAAAPILAFSASLLARRPGPALAGLTIVLALIVASGTIRATTANEPWLVYALALMAGLCLVVSGMLDDVRPRVVAGWLGLALAIAAITWAVRGSLLRRAVFLAIAGVTAVALASVLGRLLGKERRT